MLRLPVVVELRTTAFSFLRDGRKTHASITGFSEKIHPTSAFICKPSARKNISFLKLLRPRAPSDGFAASSLPEGAFWVCALAKFFAESGDGSRIHAAM